MNTAQSQLTRRTVEAAGLADVAATLVAAREGWVCLEPFKTLHFEYSAAKRTGRIQGTVIAEDSGGKRLTMACKVTMKADVVLAVDVIAQ